MVVAKLDAPHVLFRVVVVLALSIKGIIRPLPDRLPVVQLVRCLGLLGLVVDTQLHAVGRAEHGGFAATVDAALD